MRPNTSQGVTLKPAIFRVQVKSLENTSSLLPTTIPSVSSTARATEIVNAAEAIFV